LGELKRLFLAGKMMRVGSEVTDPVVFRTEVDDHIVDVTVEWEESFKKQGNNWQSFDPEKVPDSAKILSFTWY
jgi:hypothetical protein